MKKISFLTLEQIFHGPMVFNSGGKNISDKLNIPCVELFPQMEGSSISNSGVVSNVAGR